MQTDQLLPVSAHWAIPGLKRLKSRKNVKLDTLAEMDSIIKDGCAFFGEDIKDVIGRCRKRPFVVARHMLIYYLLEHGSYTLKFIAQRFRIDHTTVINARRVVQDQLYTDPQYKQIYKNLSDQLSDKTYTFG